MNSMHDSQQPAGATSRAGARSTPGCRQSKSHSQRPTTEVLTSFPCGVGGAVANAGRPHRCLLWLAVLAAFAALVQPAPVPAQKPRHQETLTATAEREGRTASLTLIINSYSTDADRLEMAAALKKGGQMELLGVLDSMRRGRIAFHGNVGREVNYIRSRTTPQGRSLLLISSRILSFFELSSGARSRDYPFNVIRLTLDRNGNGTGTMVPAAKIHFTETNEIRAESYDQIPVRLMSVRTR